MATYAASINRALQPSQEQLVDHRERCSADPDKLATIGCAVGQQVRIKRNNDEYGLYTVSEVRQENPDNVVRMGLTGRRRLGTDEEFDGVVDSQVVKTLRECDAKDQNEFTERLKDNGVQSELIAIAPHGGDIELHTDQQAERVASRLAAKAISSWRCKGWHAKGALDHWHITSTDINEASFPLLNSIISRGFRYAVAFHGFDNEPGILIGGTAPAALKREIRDAIAGATASSSFEVRIADPDEGFGGNDQRNIVNRLTARDQNGIQNGIQIEQSLPARSGHWPAIADAVAEVYGRRL
jgi:phage replication-related protein YjqB (UPF0714/DUF867 family)